MASSPQQSAGTNTYVEVVPLTLHIGAEIRGVDLSNPQPPEQLKAEPRPSRDRPRR
jgi:hypothetical protein